MAARKTAAKTPPTSKTKPTTIAGIPITREELEPHLGEEMPLFAYVYWNSFTTKLEPEQMRVAVASHASDLRALKKVEVYVNPPPVGTSVVAEFAGKKVSASIRPLRSDPSRWSLQADFRTTGDAWGSNHALFLWLETMMLPWVGAEDVRCEPWPHARQKP